MTRVTVTCPDCKRPGRGVTAEGKILPHNDSRPQFPSKPIGTLCPMSGKPFEDKRD